MSTWYAPGEHALAVGRGAIVMAPADRAADLSRLLEGAPAPLQVLSVLSGGDVARLPEFAAVVVDGADLVVLARGSYRVTYGEDAWSGEEAATWREHRVAVVPDEDVVLGEVGVADQLTLPLEAGVVLAAQVTWRPEAGVPAGEDLDPVEGAAAVAEPADADAPAPADDAAGTVGGTPGVPLPPPPDPHSTLMEAGDDFDEVVGATIQGRREPDAATRDPDTVEEAGGEEPGAHRAPLPGDHDGRTITTEQLMRLREGQPADAPAAPTAQVSATLTISTGDAVELDQPAIVGRSPRASQLSSAEMPHLVVVDDPYVSGTHLEIAVDGDAVVAIDRSTNGTTLTRPGGSPERMTKDQPTVLADGSVLGLSEDITATVTIAGADR